MTDETFLIKYHSSIPLEVIDEFKQNLRGFYVITEKLEDEEQFYTDSSLDLLRR